MSQNNENDKISTDSSLETTTEVLQTESHETKVPDVSVDEIKSDVDEEISSLILINESKINNKLTMKFYKNEDGKLIIGLDHFRFEKEEVLITIDTFKKMMEKVQFLGF